MSIYLSMYRRRRRSVSPHIVCPIYLIRSCHHRRVNHPLKNQRNSWQDFPRPTQSFDFAQARTRGECFRRLDARKSCGLWGFFQFSP